MNKPTKNRHTIYLPDEIIEAIRKDILASAVKTGGTPESLSAWMQQAARDRLDLSPIEKEA